MAPTRVIPKLIVVTAASSNHFGALRQMLESLRRLGARVECYDIGLTADEARALPRWPGFFYHPFDYAAYPAYLNAAVNAGEYAWKPVIVADVIDRAHAAGDASDVLWADAGCFFHALHPVAERIKNSSGLWVRTSAGVMREWTHPLMFEYLGVDPGAYGERRNADATLVGFAVGSAPAPPGCGLPADRAAVEDLCPGQGLHRAARIVPREPPPGSSGAVVSRSPGGLPVRRGHRRDLGVRTKCDRWFYHYIGFDVPACVYARTCLS